MRLNDNNTFIGINSPYQLMVIHSSKLIYPREISQRGVERLVRALGGVHPLQSRAVLFDPLTRRR